METLVDKFKKLIDRDMMDGPTLTDEEYISALYRIAVICNQRTSELEWENDI